MERKSLDTLPKEFENLREDLKKSFLFFIGEYTPEIGCQPLPSRDEYYKLQVNEDFLLTAGYPHPVYKNMVFQSFRENGNQRWKAGEWYRPKKIPDVLFRELNNCGLKWCSCCNNLKRLVEFGTSPDRSDGLTSKCKNCLSEESKKYIGTESYKNTSKKYYENNKEKCRESVKNWHKSLAEEFDEKLKICEDNCSNAFDINSVSDKIDEKALFLFNTLDPISKLYFAFYCKRYIPEVGSLETPPEGKKSGTADYKAMQTDLYLPSRGFPHPIYKDYVFYAHSQNYQSWVKGEWYYPKKFSNEFSDKFLKAGLKWCARCETLKTIKNFGKLEGGKGGLQQKCKKCHSMESKIFHKSEKAKATTRKYRRENREEISKRQAIRNKKLRETMSGSMEIGFRNNLNTAIRNSYLEKPKNIPSEKFLGCTFENFAKKFYKNKKSNQSYSDFRSKHDIDHVIPISLAKIIEEKGYMKNSDLERLILSLWHYSNLEAIDSNINQAKKIDNYNGKKVSKMHKNELLGLAWDLIRRVEKIRREDEWTIKKPLLKKERFW